MRFSLLIDFFRSFGVLGEFFSTVLRFLIYPNPVFPRVKLERSSYSWYLLSLFYRPQYFSGSNRYIDSLDQPKIIFISDSSDIGCEKWSSFGWQQYFWLSVHPWISQLMKTKTFWAVCSEANLFFFTKRPYVFGLFGSTFLYFLTFCFENHTKFLWLSCYTTTLKYFLWLWESFSP